MARRKLFGHTKEVSDQEQEPEGMSKPQAKVEQKHEAKSIDKAKDYSQHAKFAKFKREG